MLPHHTSFIKHFKAMRSQRLYPLLISLAIVVAAFMAAVSAQNVAIGAYVSHLSRSATDFSAAYLRRKLKSVAAAPPQMLFLGDSVLWGYGLQPSQTAVAILSAHGCACVNLAFKTGSPPNYYALVRLLQESRVRPRAIVLEINQRVFSPADDSYSSLHPAIAEVSAPLLTPGDRATLATPPPVDGIAPRLDRLLSSLWLPYAMRTDIRETWFGEADSAPVVHLTADLFLGTYDLSPLDEHNVGVRYLQKTADLLRFERIPVLAFMTPTNHALLHKIIDNAGYRANGAFLQRLLERRGIRVLNLDIAFPAEEFLDNAHLTAAGQRRLASILAKGLEQLAPNAAAASL